MTKTVDANTVCANTVCAKTVSIYAAQVLLGAIAIAAGAAKLSGTGVLVHQFQLLGIGQVFLTIAGTVEIAAGLCLLLPRGGVRVNARVCCAAVDRFGSTSTRHAVLCLTGQGWDFPADR